MTKHKHSDSNLTSAIMERMEQLEDLNQFENEETRISNKSNLKMIKITSTPVSTGGGFRALETQNANDFDNHGSVQKCVQIPESSKDNKS